MENRGRSSSTEPSIPSVLDETAIASYKRRHQQRLWRQKETESEGEKTGNQTREQNQNNKNKNKNKIIKKKEEEEKENTSPHSVGSTALQTIHSLSRSPSPVAERIYGQLYADKPMPSATRRLLSRLQHRSDWIAQREKMRFSTIESDFENAEAAEVENEDIEEEEEEKEFEEENDEMEEVGERESSLSSSSSSSLVRPLQQLLLLKKRHPPRQQSHAFHRHSPLDSSNAPCEDERADKRRCKKNSFSSKMTRTTTMESEMALEERNGTSGEERIAWPLRFPDEQRPLRKVKDDKKVNDDDVDDEKDENENDEKDDEGAKETMLRHRSRQKHSMDAEWTRRAAAFETSREALEAELVDRFLSLRQEEQRQRLRSLETTSGSEEAKQWQTFLSNHFAAAHDALLKREAAFQDELERRVMEQVSIFTEAYKKTLDDDFAERCTRMDSRIAERDRKWVSILAEERKRLQRGTNGSEEEKKEEEEASRSRKEDILLGAVGEAMQEVSALRDQLVRDHEKQQAHLLQLFMEKRDALDKKHATALHQQSAQIAKMQKTCADAVLACQGEIDALNAQLAAKDVEIHKLSTALQEQRQRVPEHDDSNDNNENDNNNDHKKDIVSFSQRCVRIRSEVSAHWQHLFDEQRQQYAIMTRALSEEYTARVEALRAEQEAKYAELSADSRQQVIHATRAAEDEWAATLEDCRRTLRQQTEKASSCEATTRELQSQVKALSREAERQRAETDVAVAAAAAKMEEEWRDKLHETRERYEQLLAAAALQRQSCVSQEDHNRVVQELQSAKLKLIEATAALAANTNAKTEEIEQEGRRRLEELAKSHHAELSAVRSQYEAKLASWRDSLTKKESEWHSQTQVSIERLQQHMQRQLEEERASCEAIVTAAHEATEKRMTAFTQESERGWAEKYAAFEKFVRQKEDQLGQREDALTRQAGEMKATLNDTLAAQMREHREHLFAQLEEEQVALAAAKEAFEEQKRQYQFKLQRSYEEKFFKAKQQLRGQQAAMCREVFALAEAREKVLVSARNEELSLLSQHLSTSLQAIAARQCEFGEAIREEMAEMFDRSATIVEVQKNALLGQMRELQKQLSSDGELACRELLEVHVEQLQAQYNTHAEDHNTRWQNLQEYVLQRTSQMDAQQRAFETNLRTHYEELLRAERAKATEAIEDLQRLNAQHVESVRTECEDASEKKLALLIKKHEDDQNRWQARIDEMVRKSEATQRELREAQGVLQRVHQQELIELQDTVEVQHAERLKALEEELSEQNQQLRAACDARVEQAVEKVKDLRAQFARDLVAVERRHLTKNELMQTELHQHFDEQLATLRSELQAKSESLASLEKAQEEAVRTRVEAAVATMQRQYEQFVEAWHARAEREVADRVTAAKSSLKAQEEAVSGMQYQMEEKMHNFTTSLQAQVKADSEKRLSAFQRRIEELQRFLEQERGEKSALQHAFGQLRLATAPTAEERPESRSPSATSSATVPRLTPTAQAVQSAVATPSFAARAYPPFAGTQYFTVTPTAASVSPPAADTGFLAPRSVNTFLPASQKQKEKTTLSSSGDRGVDGNGVGPPSSLSAFLASVPAWHRLNELWAVLEATAEERAHFKERLMLAWTQQGQQQQQQQPKQVAGEGRGLKDVILREVGRLEAQLPLLEAFARRQFLLNHQPQQQLADKENHLLSGEGSLLAPSQAAANEEIDSLTEELRRAIPQHERLFGQTFVFRGERLMEQLC